MKCQQAIDAASSPHPVGEFFAEERLDGRECPVEDSRLKHEVKALEPERETALQQTRDKCLLVVLRNPELIRRCEREKYKTYT